MGTHRTPRAERRAAYWLALISAADDEAALGLAWQWLRSELTKMADSRPEAAKSVRRELAQQIAGMAEQLPRYKPKN